MVNWGRQSIENVDFIDIKTRRDRYESLVDRSQGAYKSSIKDVSNIKASEDPVKGMQNTTEL